MAFKMDKKGQVFQQLSQLAMGLAIVAVVLIVTFLIISQGREEICRVEGLTGSCSENVTSVGVNATNQISQAVDDIPGWLPIIVLTVIGSILIGLVALFKTNARR